MDNFDKKNRFDALIIIFILAGIYIFIFSESGFLERREMKTRCNSLLEEIETLDSNNRDLAFRCENYANGVFDEKDISSSGFVSKNGKLLYFADSRLKNDQQKYLDEYTSAFKVSLDHMRIIWIIVSILVLTYYYMKTSKNTEDEEAANGTDFY